MIINNGTGNYKYVPFFEKDQCRDKLPKVKLVEKKRVDEYNLFSWRLGEYETELDSILKSLAKSINLFLEKDLFSEKFIKDQALSTVTTKMFNAIADNLNQIAKLNEEKIKGFQSFITDLIKDTFKDYSNLFSSRTNDPMEEKLNEIMGLFEFIDNAAMLTKANHMVMAQTASKGDFDNLLYSRSPIELLAAFILGYNKEISIKTVETDFAISEFNLRHRLHHKEKMQKLDQGYRAVHRNHDIMVPKKTDTTKLISHVSFLNLGKGTREVITEAPVINPFIILEQLAHLPVKAQHELLNLNDIRQVTYMQGLQNCLKESGLSTRFIDKLPNFETKLDSLCKFLVRVGFHAYNVTDTNKIYPSGDTH